MDEYNKILAGRRIRNRRNELKLTLADVGKMTDVAPSTIQRYESGSIVRPKIPVIKAIAAALNVNSMWLMGQSDYPDTLPFNALEIDRKDYVKIEIIGRVAAGLACHAEIQCDGYEYVPRDEINPSNEYVYLRVKGDSMSPLILEGDLVLVRCQDIVDSGTYAVVIIDNEDGVVKKLYMYNDRIELISENPAYPPRIFKGEERARVRVFGKVIECKHKF